MKYQAYAVRQWANEMVLIGNVDMPLSLAGKKLVAEAVSQKFIEHVMNHDGDWPDRVDICLELDDEHFLKPGEKHEADHWEDRYLHGRWASDTERG